MNDKGIWALFIPVFVLALLLASRGLWAADTQGITTAVAADGELDPSFDPGAGANEEIVSLAIQPDGKMLIGGYFTQVDSTARNRIARLNADGSLDETFDPGTGANLGVRAMDLQNDGGIVVGGLFTVVGGAQRNRIARLNTDGSVDASFFPGQGANNTVYAIAVQPDGKILIGGSFTAVDGTARNRIARLDADGNLDTTFDPGAGADGIIYALATQADGKILIGGAFSTVDGVNRNRIARLNTDGSLDASFDPGTGVGATAGGAFVFALAVQGDGKSLVGGLFSSVNGTSRGSIARLTTDGSLDSTFNPGVGPDGAVYNILPLEDGRVAIGGNFTSVDGVARNHVARLLANGDLDPSFVPSSMNDWVAAVAIQPDGKLIVGGYFTSVNGAGRNRVARLQSKVKPLVPPAPAPPVVSVDPPADATEGAAYTLAGVSFTDPTAHDTHQAYINWGDGTANTDGQVDQENDTVTASHVYTDSGTYTLSVTVRDGTGLSDTASQTVTVQNVPPAAQDDTATTVAGTPVVIHVLANDTAAPDDRLSVQSVGAAANGTLSADVEARLRYTPTLPFTGVETFTYVVADDDGTTDAATVTVTVTEESIADLTAFSDGPTVLGTATTFTATVSAGSNVSYTWAFGDGNTGSGAVVEHVYSAEGTYTATVTATNSLGSHGASAQVTVVEADQNLYLPILLRN